MELRPVTLKTKALTALKGNWQTALLVSFFAGIAANAYSVAELRSGFFPSEVTLEALSRYLMGSDPWAYLSAAFNAISPATLSLMAGLQLLSLLVSPMLELGCNHYFVSRLGGEELGFGGLFSRARYFGKALILSLYMGVKICLWGLLFIVPGYVAMLRYGLATYYLAEEPSLSVREAVEKSKAAMRGNMGSYFRLLLSFLGWWFAILAAQLLLMDIHVILALVVFQFLEVWLNAYRNGAFAAFFLAVRDRRPLAAEPRPAGDEPEGGAGD